MHHPGYNGRVVGERLRATAYRSAEKRILSSSTWRATTKYQVKIYHAQHACRCIGTCFWWRALRLRHAYDQINTQVARTKFRFVWFCDTTAPPQAFSWNSIIQPAQNNHGNEFVIRFGPNNYMIFSTFLYKSHSYDHLFFWEGRLEHEIYVSRRLHLRLTPFMISRRSRKHDGHMSGWRWSDEWFFATLKTTSPWSRSWPNVTVQP